MLDPNEIYERLVTLGEEWADAHAAAHLLDEGRKPLLAKIGAASKESSAAARESAALASKEYSDYVERMVEVTREANRAKVRYESAKIWADMIRTKAANERVTMKVAP